MTKEEKELLLKDLCARLPYDVMVNYKSHIYILNEIDPACKDIDYITVRIQDVERLMCAKSAMIEEIKPYLRPLSSMTEEEYDELEVLAYGCDCILYTSCLPVKCNAKFKTYNLEVIDWLNTHHFDYRGLIPKNLATKVTEENNPYKIKLS